MKRFINEPLLHFFVLGLLLFVLYSAVNDDNGRSPEEIVVDQSRLAGLASSFEKTWQRPPTAEEQQALVDAYIREEILYREGVAIGFDLNDPVIRRRVAQKMSFVADGVVPDSPDDAELEAWLSANADTYQVPAVYTLQQVYIDPQRHAADLDDYLLGVQSSLGENVDATTLGDSTLLPTVLDSASTIELSRVFGAAFVSSLASLSGTEWQGPIRSGYGLHFVRIENYVPARAPDLEEVRAAVERDVLSDKSEKIGEAFYTALRERYTIRIESIEQDD